MTWICSSWIYRLWSCHCRVFAVKEWCQVVTLMPFWQLIAPRAGSLHMLWLSVGFVQ